MSKQPTGNNEQQPKLVDTPPQPEVPRLVQLGFSIVNFTKPYLDRDKAQRLNLYPNAPEKIRALLGGN